MVNYFESFSKWYDAYDYIKYGVCIVAAYADTPQGGTVWEVWVHGRVCAVFNESLKDAKAFAEWKAEQLNGEE